MANIFSRIRDSFKRSFNQATSSTTAATQRNEKRNQSAPSTATGRVVDNLLTDIALGLGTLGEKDVGEAGMKDFRDRSKKSFEAMEKFQADRDKRDRGSSTPPPAAAAPTVETVAEPVAETPEPPAETKEPVKLAPVGGSTTTAGSAEEEADILEAGATGDAEKKVADTIRKKGRRQTIQTTSRGLLTDAPTRRRRSLMGGGLLT
jgi:predicted lipid-binding transport protein (Tim44 family)